MPNVMEPPATVSTVRVLIVDDEPLARDCMRLALRGATGVERAFRRLEPREAMARAALEAAGLHIERVMSEGDWRTFVLQK